MVLLFLFCVLLEIIGHLEDVRPSHFYLRCAGLMFLAWMTLVLITCVFLTLPTIIGRRIFDMLGLSLSNDVYTIGLGVYLIWAGTEAFMRLAQ